MCAKMGQMPKRNRRWISGLAGTLVLAVWIPVALAQNYFRYNAWILPVTGLIAVLFYGALYVTSPTALAKLDALHRNIGTANPLKYAAFIAIVGGAVIAILGFGEWYAMQKSQEHVSELKKADTPKIAPIPPALPSPQQVLMAPLPKLAASLQAKSKPLAKGENEPEIPTITSAATKSTDTRGVVPPPSLVQSNTQGINIGPGAIAPNAQVNNFGPPPPKIFIQPMAQNVFGDYRIINPPGQGGWGDPQPLYRSTYIIPDLCTSERAG
jgi:hypothetical protein